LNYLQLPHSIPISNIFDPISNQIYLALHAEGLLFFVEIGLSLCRHLIIDSANLTSILSVILYKKAVKSMSEKRYTLEQICRLLNMSPRTIRYYIHEGLLDHPEGQKRGAYYLELHLRQLQKIKEWQSAGYSLDRIRQLLKDGETPANTLLPLKPKRGDVQVVSRVYIAPGIELSINPDQARLNPKQTRALYRQIGHIFDQLKLSEER